MRKKAITRTKAKEIALDHIASTLALVTTSIEDDFEYCGKDKQVIKEIAMREANNKIARRLGFDDLNLD